MPSPTNGKPNRNGKWTQFYFSKPKNIDWPTYKETVWLQREINKLRRQGLSLGEILVKIFRVTREFRDESSLLKYLDEEEDIDDLPYSHTFIQEAKEI